MDIAICEKEVLVNTPLIEKVNNKKDSSDDNSRYTTQIDFKKKNDKVVVDKEGQFEFTPKKLPIKKKKDLPNIRQGTAIFTTVPTHKGKNLSLPEKIELNPEEINNSPIVSILNTNNHNLIDECLKFNGLGLIQKGRENNKKDGIIYFSHKNCTNEKIDYKLNTTYNPNENNQNGHFYLFALYFMKGVNSYNINFNQKITNTSRESSKEFINNYKSFIKITNEYPLKILSKEILQIGKTIIEINPMSNGLLSITNLSNNNFKSIYHPDQKEITFGRSSKCNIFLPEEKEISKIQATFDYISAFSCWFLKDGHENKPSTNGTWLYALNEYPLYNKMNVRIDDNQVEFIFEE